jgi:proteasome lid subunit RPN8/RPN11
MGTVLNGVRIKKDAAECFLELCREVFPNENIMLIRGKIKDGVATVSEFLIPPFSTYGEGFSGFSSFHIAFDLSLVGVAHSHPSGNTTPSNEDMNYFYGRLMLIAGYPYDEPSIAAYNSKGEKLLVSIID